MGLGVPQSTFFKVKLRIYPLPRTLDSTPLKKSQKQQIRPVWHALTPKPVTQSSEVQALKHFPYPLNSFFKQGTHLPYLDLIETMKYTGEQVQGGKNLAERHGVAISSFDNAVLGN